MAKVKRISQTNRSESKIQKRTALIFIVSVGALFVMMYFNLTVGASHITTKDFIDYLSNLDQTKQTFLIDNVRMPRMIAALFIGAALSVAGLLMQAIAETLWHRLKYLALTRALLLLSYLSRCLYLP